MRGTPQSQPDNPALVNRAGILAHLALNLLKFAMPLTGIIAWFAHKKIMAKLNEMGRFLLTPLIGGLP